MSEHDVSVDEEIATVSVGKPHVVLLGAGASKAALPNGDRNGVKVPLLRELADDLDLVSLFPDPLQELDRSNFEAAYSHFSSEEPGAEVEIDKRVSRRLRRHSTRQTPQ